MQIHTIGIDLGKTVFHLVGLNLGGEVVVRRKCSRTQLLQFTANTSSRPDRHGGMCRSSFPGKSTPGTRS